MSRGFRLKGPSVIRISRVLCQVNYKIEIYIIHLKKIRGLTSNKEQKIKLKVGPYKQTQPYCFFSG